MSISYSMINALHPLLVLVPLVPFFILNFLHWELPLAQTFIVSSMPRLPTCWPTALGFAEVCEEYPLHPLHGNRALGTVADPSPPTTAFFVKTKGSWWVGGARCQQTEVHACTTANAVSLAGVWKQSLKVCITFASKGGSRGEGSGKYGKRQSSCVWPLHILLGQCPWWLVGVTRCKPSRWLCGKVSTSHLNPSHPQLFHGPLEMTLQYSTPFSLLQFDPPMIWQTLVYLDVSLLLYETNPQKITCLPL